MKHSCAYAGCTNETYKECTKGFVFGLPASNWNWVQHVQTGYVHFYSSPPYTVQLQLLTCSRMKRSGSAMLTCCGCCLANSLGCPSPPQDNQMPVQDAYLPIQLQ